jgi:hypothetical protein
MPEPIIEWEDAGSLENIPHVGGSLASILGLSAR